MNEQQDDGDEEPPFALTGSHLKQLELAIRAEGLLVRAAFSAATYPILWTWKAESRTS